MIFTIGNTKGGVGKSTMAIQLSLGLALQGNRVWLVDGDRQKTSLAAITVRAESGRPPIAASAYDDGATLRAQVLQQAGNFDYVVIDVGGRDSSTLRAALTICDLALVPFLPRTFDVWALDDLQAVLKEIRGMRDVRVAAFLNAADTQGSDNQDASDVVAQLPGVELLRMPKGEANSDSDEMPPLAVVDRKAFAHASGCGLHISEHRPRDAKACEEMARLQQVVLDIVKESV